MELTPTLILNLALLIVPPVALVLVFRQWLTRHIRWTVALTALCDVLLFWDELFYLFIHVIQCPFSGMFNNEFINITKTGFIKCVPTVSKVN